jgi:hypothetical protein
MSVIVEFAGNHLYNVFDVPTVLGVCSKAAAAHDKSAAEGLGTFRTGEYLWTVTNILLPSFCPCFETRHQCQAGPHVHVILESQPVSPYNFPGALKERLLVADKEAIENVNQSIPKNRP